ncbi:MAG: MaoC family dehydratase [Candidatus Schekmanbacteria bacterium]|nr:MaoC family dehydratase [Candidatus Schekmanbacteria bacterium]
MDEQQVRKYFRTEKQLQFRTDFFDAAEDYEVWEEIDFANVQEIEGENTFEIKEEDVLFFAEAALDTNPLVRDPEVARRSTYGELFVHPVFITSIIFWCVGEKGRGNWIRTPGARNPGQSCVIHEYLRIGETIHIKMKPHDRFIKRGKYHLQYKVDLYNQHDVLKVETITTLILPKDREGIRRFLAGERGVDD